jgi:hypothetical protein
MRDFRLPPITEDVSDRLSRNATNNLPTKKVEVKFRGGAFYSTTAYGLLYSWPLKEFLHSSLEALQTSGVQRPQLAKEGTIDGI